MRKMIEITGINRVMNDVLIVGRAYIDMEKLSRKLNISREALRARMARLMSFILDNGLIIFAEVIGDPHETFKLDMVPVMIYSKNSSKKNLTRLANDWLIPMMNVDNSDDNNDVIEGLKL